MAEHTAGFTAQMSGLYFAIPDHRLGRKASKTQRSVGFWLGSLQSGDP
jgi:hypothetical protein